MADDKHNVILGSSSPRRKDLLSQLGLTFSCIKPETEEVHRDGENPADYVMRNSREKADWIADLESVKDQSIIISGDTIVALHGKILEKPKDQEDALRMLTSMSGQTHTVFSGMTLLQKCQDGQESSPPKVSTFVVSTDVTFKTLSEREIKGYIKTGEPMDKAGSYAIQGIGAYMVKSINGSFSNVIGMPLTELYQHLKDEFGLELHEGS